MFWLIVSALLSGNVETGALSVYSPGDGMNAGELACGGTFTAEQVHIAHRRWRALGCGRMVLVCARQTSRCALAQVMDAGPFGIIRGPLRRVREEGRWKVHLGSRPPRGWRWRAAVDLSWALWEKLGRPAGLSQVTMIFLPAQVSCRLALRNRVEFVG